MLYLAAESSSDNLSRNLPKIPIELLVHRYRKEFHLSWKEFIEGVPPEIFFADLDIMSIESGVLKSKYNASTGKSK